MLLGRATTRVMGVVATAAVVLAYWCSGMMAPPLHVQANSKSNLMEFCTLLSTGTVLPPCPYYAT